MLHIVVNSYASLCRQSKAVAIMVPGNSLADIKLPASIKNTLTAAAQKKLFKYKFGEIKFFPSPKGKLDWLAVVPSGATQSLEVMKLNKLIASLVRQAQKLGNKTLQIYIPEIVIDKFGADKIGEISSTASLTAVYENVRHKSRPVKSNQLNKIVVIVPTNELVKQCTQGVKIGRVIGETINLARDYGNRPANELTP